MSRIFGIPSKDLKGFQNLGQCFGFVILINCVRLWLLG